MRRATVAVLCTFITFAMTNVPLAEAQESPAFADGAESADGRMRMRPNQQQRLLGQLFMMPVYFMGYIVVHEGSHALAGLSFGWNIESFEPYPHTAGQPDGSRNFVFGSVCFLDRTENFSDARLAVMYVMPYITDVFIFTAADLLLEYAIDPRSAAAPFLLVGGMVTPLVNFVTGLNCMGEYCDMSRFSERSGIPRGAVMMIGYSMAFVALWRCIHQFRRIFMEPVADTREREPAVSVSPVVAGEVVGMNVTARF